MTAQPHADGDGFRHEALHRAGSEYLGHAAQFVAGPQAGVVFSECLAVTETGYKLLSDYASEVFHR